MQQTWVQSLGWVDTLEEGMTIHSSILAWRVPWTEEPGGLQSMESQRVGHDWATKHRYRAFEEFYTTSWLNNNKIKSHTDAPKIVMLIQYEVNDLMCLYHTLYLLKNIISVFIMFIFGHAGCLLLPRTFSSCGEWGLLSSCSVRASHCSGFSGYRARILGHMGFRAVAPQASERRLTAVAPRLSCSAAWEYSWTTGWNRVFYIGRWIL